MRTGEFYILIGVKNGESYPGQYGGIGYTGDKEIPVAIFSSVADGVDYILKNTLKNPNYSKHEIFFKDSLLAGFDSAFVDRKPIPFIPQYVQEKDLDFDDLASNSHYWR